MSHLMAKKSKSPGIYRMRREVTHHPIRPLPPPRMKPMWEWTQLGHTHLPHRLKAPPASTPSKILRLQLMQLPPSYSDGVIGSTSPVTMSATLPQAMALAQVSQIPPLTQEGYNPLAALLHWQTHLSMTFSMLASVKITKT